MQKKAHCKEKRLGKRGLRPPFSVSENEIAGEKQSFFDKQKRKVPSFLCRYLQRAQEFFKRFLVFRQYSEKVVALLIYSNKASIIITQ